MSIYVVRYREGPGGAVQTATLPVQGNVGTHASLVDDGDTITINATSDTELLGVLVYEESLHPTDLAAVVAEDDWYWEELVPEGGIRAVAQVAQVSTTTTTTRTFPQAARISPVSVASSLAQSAAIQIVRLIPQVGRITPVGDIPRPIPQQARVVLQSQVAATIASDTFADIATTDLLAHTSSSGHTWARHPASSSARFLIGDDGRVYNNVTAFSAQRYLISAVPPSPDYDVSVDLHIVTDNDSSNVGPVGRAHATEVAYYCALYASSSNRIRLQRCVAGVEEDITAYTPEVFGDGRLTLRMRGDQISVLWNGKRIMGPYTDRSITDAGFGGVRATGTASAVTGLHFDNFAMATLPTIDPGTWDPAKTVHLVSDTHVGYSLPARMEAVRSVINEMTPMADTLVHVGDISDLTVPISQGVAWVATLDRGAEMYAIIGNHDMGQSSPSAWVAAYGKSQYWTKDIGADWRIIGVGLNSSVLTLNVAARTYIADRLAETTRKCAIIAHTALVGTGGTTDTSSGMAPEAELRDLLDANPNAKIWVYGHTHVTPGRPGMITDYLLPSGRKVWCVTPGAPAYEAPKPSTVAESADDPMTMALLTLDGDVATLRVRNVADGLWLETEGRAAVDHRWDVARSLGQAARIVLYQRDVPQAARLTTLEATLTTWPRQAALDVVDDAPVAALQVVDDAPVAAVGLVAEGTAAIETAPEATVVALDLVAEPSAILTVVSDGPAAALDVLEQGAT